MSTDQLTAPTAFKDRKTGLLVFGVFLIVLGAFFALSLLGTLFVQLFLANRPEFAAQLDHRALLPSIVYTGSLAAAAIWLGIGSILCRRWARALALCLGSIGLAIGTFGFLFLIAALPSIEAGMRQHAAIAGNELPPIAITMAKVFSLVFGFCFYVAIPGALVLFYRSRHVKLTCEARDPVVRWTDRCPLPVLAVVLLQALGAVALLLAVPQYGGVFPVAGFVVPAPWSYAIYAALAVANGVLAVGTFRLNLRAYWAYVALLVFGVINAPLALRGGKLMEYYRALDLPEAQLKSIEAMPLFHGDAFGWLTAAGIAVMLGYVVWLKRYFPRTPYV